MSKWSLTERLQPSLLDRLTDERPDKKKESAGDSELSQHELKNAVIRDLGSLLNSVNLSVVEDLDDYPEVKKSVLNYGVPELSGHSMSSVNAKEMEKAVRLAILEFEPRIIRNSLRIKVSADRNSMAHNALSFSIEGAIFGQPAPFQVLLQSRLDLESGDFVVTES